MPHPPAPTWLLLASIVLPSARMLLGCTTAQARVVETMVAHLGCELVAVLAHSEQVGTLCSDIAPGVETEIARTTVASASPLLAHRSRRHSRPVRVAEHVPGRDHRNAETIEPEYLEHVRRVAERLAKEGSAG